MGAPRSKEFEDVYFSAENGFAETHYVFLRGNGLPEGWAGREHFTICETGFGTGLNFLCAWKLWNETMAGQKLEFISFEKFPLSAGEIEEALAGFQEKFPAELAKLIWEYPAECSGTHRIAMSDNVTLTLIFGDVNEEMPRLEAKIDCWFLDGFKPRKNPDMWTGIVFKNMERLSIPGTTFATFTAAGFVKRGLQAAGFKVNRIKGYGFKWHMIKGHKI